MAILQRYIIRTVAASMAMVLIGFIGLDLLFRVVEEVDGIIGNYTFSKVLVFELLRTPKRIYEIMPMTCLIGCLTGLGALANNSELTVIRSAGISTISLAWTTLKIALVFLLTAILIGEFVTPKTDQMAKLYRDMAKSSSVNMDVANFGIWLRDEDSFVYAEVVQPTGVMLGLTIFEFSGQSIDSIKTVSRASFAETYWLLEDITRLDFENSAGIPQQINRQEMATEKWHSSIKPDILNVSVQKPENLGIASLWRYIHYLQDQNLSSKEYELAMWERLFFPLSMISLVLVGISFVFGPLRQVTMGYRVFWGIMIGILFKTMQDTVGPVSVVFGLQPVIAMLIPPLVCALLGLFMLSRVR